MFLFFFFSCAAKNQKKEGEFLRFWTTRPQCCTHKGRLTQEKRLQNFQQLVFRASKLIYSLLRFGSDPMERRRCFLQHWIFIYTYEYIYRNDYICGENMQTNHYVITFSSCFFLPRVDSWFLILCVLACLYYCKINIKMELGFRMGIFTWAVCYRCKILCCRGRECTILKMSSIDKGTRTTMTENNLIFVSSFVGNWLKSPKRPLVDRIGLKVKTGSNQKIKVYKNYRKRFRLE